MSHLDNLGYGKSAFLPPGATLLFVGDKHPSDPVRERVSDIIRPSLTRITRARITRTRTRITSTHTT